MRLCIVLFCFTVFMALQPTSRAIKCYVCDAGTDGCGPSFKKTGSGVVTISDPDRKYCAKDVAISNKNAIRRYFSFSQTCGTNPVNDDDSFKEYCCSTDLCNGSPVVKASLIFAVILAFFALLRFE